MQSPFKIFRRFQKALLAFLAVMAMIAFGVGDQLVKMTQRIGGSAAAQPVVETSAGNLTQNGLRDLMHRRHIANTFVYKAVLTSNPEYEKIARFIPNLVPNFGTESPSDVVLSWLMQHEAQRMGIVVDDQQIREFIQESTNQKLTLEQFTLILKSMQLSAKELYEILRDELACQRAYRMTRPVASQSPEQYWKFYRQLHTRQKIEVAPLPIRDFAAAIETPSLISLEKFFEAHRSRVEVSADGERKPGFRQPPKVKLHTLKLTELDIEQQVVRESPVTDRDIEEYYEAKKLIDRRMQIVDPAPTADGEKAPLRPVFAGEEKRPAPPAVPSSEPSTTLEQKDPCASTGVDEAEQTGTAAGGSQQSTEDDKPAAKTVEATADDAAPAAKGSGETADDAGKLPSEILKGAGKSPVRDVKFKPLDDILRGEIRDSILHERTVKRMKDVASKIAEAVRDVGLRFAQQKEFVLVRPNAEQVAYLTERSRTELQAIAKKYGAAFGETGLVNPRELSELPGIGKTQEADANDLSQSSGRSVIEMAFDGDTLCRVFEAETSASAAASFRDMYVFWKVQDVPAHVPKFDEPGVKDQVIDAWKLQQALPLARKRAEQLAMLIRNSNEATSTVLAGQTVTGEASAGALLVQESPEFPWFRESFAPDPGMRQPPIQLANPVVVTAAGYKFMEYVFDELKEGDVGVTLNDDASVCYVVKVISRRPADRDAFKNAPLFSPSSPYGRLAEMEQRLAASQFFQQIEKSYAVKWHERDSDNGGPSTDE